MKKTYDIYDGALIIEYYLKDGYRLVWFEYQGVRANLGPNYHYVERLNGRDSDGFWNRTEIPRDEVLSIEAIAEDVILARSELEALWEELQMAGRKIHFQDVAIKHGYERDRG